MEEADPAEGPEEEFLGYTCDFESGRYKLSFQRYDGFPDHAICHLDIEADHALAAEAEGAMMLLETLPWQLSVGLREEDESPFLVCAASGMMARPGVPICGFVVEDVPWDFALHMIDGYRRSGTLMLHMMMQDSHGKDLEVESPIFSAAFFVIDPSGRLNERLAAEFSRRN